jgi:uncharacterized protein YdcH (DUF465 family)
LLLSDSPPSPDSVSSTNSNPTDTKLTAFANILQEQLQQEEAGQQQEQEKAKGKLKVAQLSAELENVLEDVTRKWQEEVERMRQTQVRLQEELFARVQKILEGMEEESS